MNITQLKESISGQTHSGTVNKIRNFNELCKRAAGNVIAKIDPRETRRITNLATIHDDVYNYTAPSDLKKTVDIRPQTNRDSSDNFSQWFSEEFDKYKGSWDDLFQVRHSDGTKSLRISKDITPAPVTLNNMDSLTANGTVAIVGSASGLTTNDLYYVSGTKSIEVDLSADGDGIQITGMTSKDLEDHDETSEMFVRVYLPSTSNLTSITGTWGNDLTTNYWDGVAQTEQSDGTAFRTGWNVIKIPWRTATESGTVDPTAIDSLKLTFSITGAINNIRIDFWTSSIGEIFEIEYYSKYLFRSTSGTWKEKPTSDSDLINLDSDTFNIFIYEVLMEASQQMQGSDSDFDIQYAQNRLVELYAKHKESYPDEAIKPQSRYYKL